MASSGRKENGTSFPTLWVGRLAVALLVFSGCGCSPAAEQAEQAPALARLDGLPPYDGKSAAEWIELLTNSADANSRSKAAEALGYVARESSMTRGGFSDAPFDSPEPIRLSDEQLQPIVKALVGGLSDSQSQVRASSAVGVSWIGPRANSAAPALVRLLDDRDNDVKKSALTAIGRLGPAAKEALPRLARMLAGGAASERVQIAEAMQLVGAAPDSYVPTLISILAHDRSAHNAAMELAKLGDPAVPALLVAFKHSNPIRRKYAAYAIANMAGWGKLMERRETVADALIELTRDEDRGVVWHAAQAIGTVHAAPEHSVPALVSLLKHEDASIVANAADALGEFGAEAKPALSALVEMLGDGNQQYAWHFAHSIREIGIDGESVAAIRRLKVGDEGAWLLIPLLQDPEAAREFLERNPQVVDVPVADRAALIDLMRDPDARFQPLQESLYNCAHLPLAVMAQLADARFLPLLRQRLMTANAHERTRLAACARACGEPAGRVVEITESLPGDFKPKSAWPDTDAARMSPTAKGHGDGTTEVIVTGRLLRADGAPAAAPKFYRINDAMLLGSQVREAAAINYDARTGHFIFVTQVFAAYTSGDDAPEPGPYQTGSSLVLIESEACKPLEVQFYDEMPEVRITLSPHQQKPGE